MNVNIYSTVYKEKCLFRIGTCLFVGCRGKPGSDILELWKLSSKCFDTGIDAFDNIEDVINMALVHSNK